MRLVPAPRVVDAGIIVAVSIAVGSGILSLISGRPADAWVFALHGITGLSLLALVALKLWRVAPRLRRPNTWDQRVAVSLVTLGVAAAALATGIAWSFGGRFGIWRWTGLSVHILFGLLTVPVLLAHLTYRFRLPSRVDFEGRRTAVQLGLLVLGGAIAWRTQQLLIAILGRADRFTGSRRVGRSAGNTFPVTAWVADDPDPIARDAWSLRIDGAVDRPTTLDFEELETTDTARATLDCTSGWYTDQRWSGVRVGRLLERVGLAQDARWVSFRSVTGYRWSLPLAEAEETILATRVGGEQLTHGHGAPLRLVAPGRRGFQWVKWVERVEIRRTPDYGQWVAIFTSGFD